MSKKALVIEEFEGILAELTANGKSYWDANPEKVNSQLFGAYCRDRDSGNSRINITDTIWSEEIQPIVETMRRLDIKEFTISSTSSSLFQNLLDFKKFGVVIADTILVNNVSGDRKIPALLMRVE